MSKCHKFSSCNKFHFSKVLFKKGNEDDKTPKLKDFHLDPEYRKYVFAEEYLDNCDQSHRDQLRRQEREASRRRRLGEPSETKIGKLIIVFL